MTEIEVPIEKIQEDIHHAVHHSDGHGGKDHNKMMMVGALLSAILAVFAAISALVAGHNANEAMLLQIQSSDRWSYYQAKGIKATITDLKITLAQRELQKESAQKDLNKDSKPEVKAEQATVDSLNEKLETYKKEQEEIKLEAEHKQAESETLLHKHESLATAVTFFQVAIALTAIAVLARKGQFMYLSGLLGLLGLAYFGFGLLHS